MRIETSTATLHLARGQILRVADAVGRTVCSTDGDLWITEDGNIEDIVLEKGACHRLRAGALVHALSSATVSLS